MKRLDQGERSVKVRTDRRISELCPVTELENFHFAVLCRKQRLRTEHLRDRLSKVLFPECMSLDIFL